MSIAISTKWRVQKRVNFLKEAGLFQGVNARLISTLVYHIKVLTLTRNQVLFKEGDEVTHIYVIKKGEITLQKEVQLKLEVDTSSPMTDVIKIKTNIKKIVQVPIQYKTNTKFFWGSKGSDFRAV